MIHQVEVLENILSRLPPKSIGRFRCVSKPWRSILSQPHFIRAHLDRTKSMEEQSIIFLCDESGSLYSIQLNANEAAVLPTRLDIGNCPLSSESIVDHVASCDGLILLKDEDDKLLLVNPTTRELNELAAAPCALKPDDMVTTQLYGLGYDSLTDDYKVLSLSYYNGYFEYYYGNSSNSEDFESDCYDTSVSVYSVKYGTWKTVDSSPCNHKVAHDSSGVFVNGRIHFIASSKIIDNSSVIVAFDLEKEEFVAVPSPSFDDCRRFVLGRLAMVEGCLCMLPSSFHNCQTIMVMKEYNIKESWTKFTVVNYEDQSIRPLCSLGKDQTVLLLGEDSDEEQLIIYNLEEGESKDIVVQEIGDDLHVIGTFIESLVSPHCICKQ